MWRKCLGAFSARVAFSHLPGDTVAKVYEIPSTFAHNQAKEWLGCRQSYKRRVVCTRIRASFIGIGLIVSEFKLVV